MPTLATGTWANKPRASARRPRPRLTWRAPAGFTLVEIMIVVFIIGLITAAAVITFGGASRDTELDREAERISALLDYAREQAELQTRDYGLRTNLLNYQFVVFNPLTNEWQLVTDDDALRERRIPEGLRPSLVIEGRTVVLESKWPNVSDFKPQVMVFGNGDITSFEFALTRPETGAVARVLTGEDSLLRLQLPGEPKALTAIERAMPPIG